MDLIDLKKDAQPIDSEEMYDEPMYSYGLCISLGKTFFACTSNASPTSSER